MKTSRTALWLVGLVIGGGLILSRANFAQEDDWLGPLKQVDPPVIWANPGGNPSVDPFAVPIEAPQEIVPPAEKDGVDAQPTMRPPELESSSFEPNQSLTPTTSAPAQNPIFVPTPQEPKTTVFAAKQSNPWTEKISEALDGPLHEQGLEFRDTPLAEVAAYLSEVYDIDVQLDEPALNDLGLSGDEPVNVNLHNHSLGFALRYLLRQLDLTYVIDDEVLLITSEDTACYKLSVAVYPVGDILAVKQGYKIDSDAKDKTRQPEDIDALIAVIISTVASDTWVENGGPEAEIRPLQPGLLVVSQTADVHEQIFQLLDALRQAKKQGEAVPHADLDYQQQLAAARHYEAAVEEYIRQLREYHETHGDDDSDDTPPQPPIPLGGGGFF